MVEQRSTTQHITLVLHATQSLAMTWMWQQTPCMRCLLAVAACANDGCLVVSVARVEWDMEGGLDWVDMSVETSELLYLVVHSHIRPRTVQLATHRTSQEQPRAQYAPTHSYLFCLVMNDCSGKLGAAVVKSKNKCMGIAELQYIVVVGVVGWTVWPLSACCTSHYCSVYQRIITIILLARLLH